MVGKPTYISSAATTRVTKAPCVLERIIVGETAAGAISIYDDTDSTADCIGVLKASVAEGPYEFGAKLKNGCSVVTAAASKITVVVS